MRGFLLTALALSLSLGPVTEGAAANDVLAQDSTTTSDDRRFKRAPFRTYNDRVGPQLPQAVTKFDAENHPMVELRQLDKMTGNIETFTIATADEVQVGRLRIRADACRTSEDASLGGSIAFLKIWDLRNQDSAPGFSGWMFAESPALSALDHPRYDVWVIRCITSSEEAEADKE